MIAQGKERLWRLGFLLCLSMAAMLISASQARAACAPVPWQGEWVNDDPDTRSIRRAVTNVFCYDVITPDMPVPPGPPGTLQLYGACTPADCPWPPVPYYESAMGWKIAFVDHGFARRVIHFRHYPPRAGANRENRPRLRIIVETFFTDGSGRRNYRTDEWFSRLSVTGEPLPGPGRP